MAAVVSVPAEYARRVSSTPAPERIEVDGGTEVIVDWDDGTATRLSAARLRQLCPCAGCKEGPGRRQLEAVLEGPEPVTIEAASLVGAYAINFVFGPDGHGTGIYSFRGLHELGSAPSAHDG